MRFREFKNIWSKKSLHDITKKINIKNKNRECKNVICNSAQLGLIRQIDFFDKEIAQDGSIENYTIIKKNDFVYNPRKSLNAPYGPVNIYNYNDDGIVSPLYLCFSVHDINKKFLHYYFKSQAWYRFIYLNGDSGARHDRVSIKDDVFFGQNLYLPNTIEQQKISEFLTLIDQRIDTQSKIIEDLEFLIKGIRYKIFSRNTILFKTIQKSKLGDYLIEYNERNINNDLIPVAIGKYGIRQRNEIFSKELAKNYSLNKVIKQDSLIIGMGSNQIDIGILFDNLKFCVSPAYTTYLIKNINAFYLNEYLLYLNPLLSNKYMIISARQGKSVNKSELLKHELVVHNNEEQIKIEKLFKVFYAKLQLEKDILQAYKRQKAYLLKNMFI